MLAPRVLKNFTAYIDGRGYAGRVTTVTVPTLELTTEDFRAGGMDTPIELEMGMNKIEGELTLAEYDADTLKLWGMFGAGVQITLRGGTQRQGQQEITPVQIRMTAHFKSVSREAWEAGKNSPMTLAYTATAYQESIGGEEIMNIDVLNFTRVINGVDQLAGMRAALGM